MNLKLALIQALEDKYNSEISSADATIKIYLLNSVGIGEIVDAEEKIKALQPFKL